MFKRKNQEFKYLEIACLSKNSTPIYSLKASLRSAAPRTCGWRVLSVDGLATSNTISDSAMLILGNGDTHLLRPEAPNAPQLSVSLLYTSDGDMYTVTEGASPAETVYGDYRLPEYIQSGDTVTLTLYNKVQYEGGEDGGGAAYTNGGVVSESSCERLSARSLRLNLHIVLQSPIWEGVEQSTSFSAGQTQTFTEVSLPFYPSISYFSDAAIAHADDTGAITITYSDPVGGGKRFVVRYGADADSVGGMPPVLFANMRTLSTDMERVHLISEPDYKEYFGCVGRGLQFGIRVVENRFIHGNEPHPVVCTGQVTVSFKERRLITCV